MNSKVIYACKSINYAFFLCMLMFEGSSFAMEDGSDVLDRMPPFKRRKLEDFSIESFDRKIRPEMVEVINSSTEIHLPSIDSIIGLDETVELINSSTEVDLSSTDSRIEPEQVNLTRVGENKYDVPPKVRMLRSTHGRASWTEEQKEVLREKSTVYIEIKFSDRRYSTNRIEYFDSDDASDERVARDPNTILFSLRIRSRLRGDLKLKEIFLLGRKPEQVDTEGKVLFSCRFLRRPGTRQTPDDRWYLKLKFTGAYVGESEDYEIIFYNTSNDIFRRSQS